MILNWTDLSIVVEWRCIQGEISMNEEMKKRMQIAQEEEERAVLAARRSPYRRFLQANKNAYKEEDWLMKESPAAYRLLRFIAQNMDNYNALICSYQVFQETLGYSRPTIAKAIKLLRDHQYIIYCKKWSNKYLFHQQKSLLE